MRAVRAWVACALLAIAWPVVAAGQARGDTRVASREAARPRVVGKARAALGTPIRHRDARLRAKAPLDPADAAAAEIRALLRGPLGTGTTGLYVVDAHSGQELFAIHADDPLNPASNVKLIASAAALDTLGPDFRYATRVLGRSPDGDGVVRGDLYLLGSYDPTLARGHLDEMAAQLVAAGVKRVEGKIVIGHTPTRDGIYQSRIKVDVRAGRPGERVLVELAPAYDFVTLEVRAKTAKQKRSNLSVREEMFTTVDGKERLRVIVDGTIGKNRSLTRFITPRERGLHTAHLFRAALVQAGVAVTGDAAKAELEDYVRSAEATAFLPVELAAHRSAPLADIVAAVNKRSINWLADRVVMTAAAAKYREAPSLARAVDLMYEWLDKHAGLARTDCYIDTGSGLSYRTELSARQIVKVLRAGSGLDSNRAPIDRTTSDAYLASLSIGGTDGTLRGRFASLRGLVRGKTGTLNRVVALSGLVEAAAGRTLAFAIVSNGHAPRRRERVRAAHEQLVRLVADYARHLEPTPAVTDVAPLVTRAAELEPLPSIAVPTDVTTAAAVVTPQPLEIENAEEGADPAADLPTAAP